MRNGFAYGSVRAASRLRCVKARTVAADGQHADDEKAVSELRAEGDPRRSAQLPGLHFCASRLSALAKMNALRLAASIVSIGSWSCASVVVTPVSTLSRHCSRCRFFNQKFQACPCIPRCAPIEGAQRATSGAVAFDLAA